MPHMEAAPIKTDKKKGSGKIVAIDIRILDDWTYIYSVRTDNFEDRKEYSYQSVSALVSALRQDLTGRKIDNPGSGGKEGKNSLNSEAKRTYK